MRCVPELHSEAIKQTRFNMKFTPGTRYQTPRAYTPTINHAPAKFTENKRYAAKPRPVDDVVNQNRDSVYQTEVVLILAGGVPKRFSTNASGARCRFGAPKTKAV